jgi:hypothetical protein
LLLERTKESSCSHQLCEVSVAGLEQERNLWVTVLQQSPSAKQLPSAGIADNLEGM